MVFLIGTRWQCLVPPNGTVVRCTGTVAATILRTQDGPVLWVSSRGTGRSYATRPDVANVQQSHPSLDSPGLAGTGEDLFEFTQADMG